MQHVDVLSYVYYRNVCIIRRRVVYLCVHPMDEDILFMFALYECMYLMDACILWMHVSYGCVYHMDVCIVWMCVLNGWFILWM